MTCLQSLEEFVETEVGEELRGGDVPEEDDDDDDDDAGKSSTGMLSSPRLNLGSPRVSLDSALSSPRLSLSGDNGSDNHGDISSQKHKGKRTGADKKLTGEKARGWLWLPFKSVARAGSEAQAQLQGQHTHYAPVSQSKSIQQEIPALTQLKGQREDTLHVQST